MTCLTAAAWAPLTVSPARNMPDSLGAAVRPTSRADCTPLELVRGGQPPDRFGPAALGREAADRYTDPVPPHHHDGSQRSPAIWKLMASDTLRLVLGSNNLYLVSDGSDAVLIDAGPDYAGAWEELCAQLGAAGLTPAGISTVVLTHGHLDHAGLAARWQQAGARIIAGRGEGPLLALDDAGRGQLWQRAAEALRAHGVPEPLAHRRGPGGGSGGRGPATPIRWPSPLRMTPLVPDQFVDGGDLVISGRVRLTVQACPGHTPGTIVVIDRHGQLYSGDHVLPRMIPTTGIQFDHAARMPTLPAYVRSLERCRGFAYAAILPGHGEKLADGPPAIDWTLRAIERRAERLHRLLLLAPGAAYDLATRMLKHLTPAHVWPVMAETIGLLDLLVERGLVTGEAADGRIIFRARES